MLPKTEVCLMLPKEEEQQLLMHNQNNMQNIWTKLPKLWNGIHFAGT